MKYEKHIGGWWRLWIALASLYAILVFVYVAISWPTLQAVEHHPSFMYRMPDSVQAILRRPAPRTVAELEDALRKAESQQNSQQVKAIKAEINSRQKEPWFADPIILEMPNGYQLEVPGHTVRLDSEKVARAYFDVLQNELRHQYTHLALKAFLTWLVPVVTLCLGGLLARWVYSGFKAKE